MKNVTIIPWCKCSREYITIDTKTLFPVLIGVNLKKWKEKSEFNNNHRVSLADFFDMDFYPVFDSLCNIN